MGIWKKIVFLILGFALSACTRAQYVEQNAALIVFKTPTFKYADMGFIYKNDEEVKAEIYGSGQALMTLTISQSTVCMSLLKCMSKENFNKKVLSVFYPDEIIGNIFRGTVIFNGLGLEKNSNGFTQTIIKENKYNIQYKVLNNEIVFRDTINNILIKIKKQH